MDVTAAAAGPSLALGIAVTGAVLALAVAVALAVTSRRTRRTPAAAGEPGPWVFPDDDLPAFRDHPPGFPGARPAGAPAGQRPAAGPAAPAGDPVRALTVLALVALLLITAAAAVAALSGGAAAGRAAEPRPVPSPTPPAAGPVAARLAFDVVVLERHPVGVTVTRPEVTVTAAADGTARGHLRLPRWNCLTGQATADPAAAGCRATSTEHADLSSPALSVSRSHGELRLSGRFPAYRSPGGVERVGTGRTYTLALVARAEDPAAAGWTGASGELVLGDARAPAVDDPAVSAVLVGP
ncbi:hypothetical protein [Geodermatophilus sp. SYSU D00815]